MKAYEKWTEEKVQRKSEIAEQIEQHEKIIQALKKERPHQKEKTQKIDNKYQKLMRPRLQKSVKQMINECEDNLKKQKNLIPKSKRSLRNTRN